MNKNESLKPTEINNMINQDENSTIEISNHLNQIQTSLKNNQDCRSNVFKPISSPYYTKKGCMPSRDKEILVLLSESYYGNRFYAHVFKNIKNNKWVSLIAWMPSVIATAGKNEIFKVYTSFFSNLEYAPCAIQEQDQGFKEDNNFSEACVSISNMISLFESKERMYDNEGVFQSKSPNSCAEMRIYSVYY